MIWRHIRQARRRLPRTVNVCLEKASAWALIAHWASNHTSQARTERTHRRSYCTYYPVVLTIGAGTCRTTWRADCTETYCDEFKSFKPPGSMQSSRNLCSRLTGESIGILQSTTSWASIFLSSIGFLNSPVAWSPQLARFHHYYDLERHRRVGQHGNL